MVRVMLDAEKCSFWMKSQRFMIEIDGEEQYRTQGEIVP